MSSVSNKEKPPDVHGCWRSYVLETQSFELNRFDFFFNDEGIIDNVE